MNLLESRVQRSELKRCFLVASIQLIPPPLNPSRYTVQRVDTFKLLGVHLDANLTWTGHVSTIVSRANNRFYFLKQLKRAGVPPQQLLHFYTAVIRPVLEYASPVCVDM